MSLEVRGDWVRSGECRERPAPSFCCLPVALTLHPPTPPSGTPRNAPGPPSPVTSEGCRPRSRPARGSRPPPGGGSTRRLHSTSRSKIKSTTRNAMVHHGVEWIVASRSEAGRFFGQNLHTQKQADLVLVDSWHPAGSHLPRHAHERAYFCLNHGGSYSEAHRQRG